jgi:thiol-disulfide isomerase/thioredoxin
LTVQVKIFNIKQNKDMVFEELTQDNLGEILSTNEMVMVQFGAGWCGNCKITKPKFKRLATENENIKFVYVDAENYPNSRSFASVTNLPTFAGYFNGELIKESQGNKEEVIKDIIEDVLSQL